MSPARRHRIEAEFRALRRRLRMSGKSLREYVVDALGSERAAAASPQQIGEIVAERIRDELARLRVDPRQVAQEVAKMVEARLAALPAGEAPAAPAAVPAIPVDDIQAMLDRILGRPV
jgi:hypothetical protein